ncbi:MAG: histidine phosphatase family protein [Polyangiaceae bacterium]
MRIVYLARHGQTAWNAAGRLQGHTDVPLDEMGLAQAASLAATLRAARITSVVASDLSRARATGDIVATALGVDAPMIDPELRERRFGVFEGLTRDECERDHPDAWRAWCSDAIAPPNAEPSDAVVGRFARAMERASHLSGPNGSPLVVAHGGAMRLWLRSVLGRPIDPVGNTAVFEVFFRDRIDAAPWPHGW